MALGSTRAWVAQTAGLGLAAALTVVIAPAGAAIVGDGGVLSGSDAFGLLGTLRVWGVVVGIGLIGLGAAALLARRASIRERGWELEAIGVAAVGVGWLAGTASVMSLAK